MTVSLDFIRFQRSMPILVKGMNILRQYIKKHIGFKSNTNSIYRESLKIEKCVIFIQFYTESFNAIKNRQVLNTLKCRLFVWHISFPYIVCKCSVNKSHKRIGIFL